MRRRTSSRGRRAANLKNIATVLTIHNLFFQGVGGNALFRFAGFKQNLPRIIATGGLAGLIAPETRSIKEIDEHLTLRGLQIIYNLVQAKFADLARRRHRVRSEAEGLLGPSFENGPAEGPDGGAFDAGGDR